VSTNALVNATNVPISRVSPAHDQPGRLKHAHPSKPQPKICIGSQKWHPGILITLTLSCTIWHF
jgi:hypothetical protein